MDAVRLSVPLRPVCCAVAVRLASNGDAHTPIPAILCVPVWWRVRATCRPIVQSECWTSQASAACPASQAFGFTTASPPLASPKSQVLIRPGLPVLFDRNQASVTSAGDPSLVPLDGASPLGSHPQLCASTRTTTAVTAMTPATGGFPLLPPPIGQSQSAHMSPCPSLLPSPLPLTLPPLPKGASAAKAK